MLGLIRENEEIIYIDKSILDNLIVEKDLKIIDTRSTVEFDNLDIIEEAMNIPINSKDFERKIDELDKKYRYLVYCNNGRRSEISLKYFKNKGFKEILLLKRGLEGIFRD